MLVRGEDRIVVRAIPSRTHYANVGTDYVVVVDRLVARRRFNVRTIDVEDFIHKEEQNESIQFVGEIEGIAVIREIMEITTELPYFHPIVGDRDLSKVGNSTQDLYYN